MRKIVILNVLFCVFLAWGCCHKIIVKQDLVSLGNVATTKASVQGLLDNINNGLDIERDTNSLIKINEKVIKDAEYEGKKAKNENTISQYDSLKNILSMWLKDMQTKDKARILRFVDKHGKLIIGALDEIMQTEENKPKN